MREYHKQVLLGLKFLLSRGLPLVLVSAAAAGVFLLKTPNSAKQASAPGARDPNATVGQYEGKSEAEIQAELDKVVQEGMFNISINPDIRMTSGRAEAELRVENIPANHHLMSVTLSRDDTGGGAVCLRPHRTGISHSGGAAGDCPARRQLYGNSTVYSIRSGNGTARRTGCGKSPDHSSKVRKRAIYSGTCKWLVFVDAIALSRSPAASAYPAPPRRHGRGAPSPPARNISAGG